MLKYASLVAQTGKNLPAMWETPIRSLDWEDPLVQTLPGLKDPPFQILGVVLTDSPQLKDHLAQATPLQSSSHLTPDS